MSDELTSGQKSHYTKLINGLKAESEALILDISSKVERAEELEASLFDDNDSESLVTKIKSVEALLIEAKEQTEEKTSNIEEFHNKLFEARAGEKSTEKNIEEEYEYIQSTIREINDLKDDLGWVYEKIFGEKD